MFLIGQRPRPPCKYCGVQEEPGVDDGESEEPGSAGSDARIRSRRPELGVVNGERKKEEESVRMTAVPGHPAV